MYVCGEKRKVTGGTTLYDLQTISLPHKPAVWHVLLEPLADISCRQCKSCVDVPGFIELHFLMTKPITLFGPWNKTYESSGKLN